MTSSTMAIYVCCTRDLEKVCASIGALCHKVKEVLKVTEEQATEVGQLKAEAMSAAM